MTDTMTDTTADEGYSIKSGQPIHARLKRIARHNEKKLYNTAEFDEKHVNITMRDFPRVGEPFDILWGSLENWRTSPVTYVSFQDGKILFGTENSTYEILSE